MRVLHETFRRRLLRFARNDRAVAAVEFALILPFLIALYMGSIEASSLFTVDRRIEVISATTADLVARWNPNEGALPNNTLKDYFRAAEGIITPYATATLKQVVTFLNVAANGDARVAWSCGFNGGTALSTNQAFTLNLQMKRLVTGADADLAGGSAGFLIVATTSYSYRPVLGMVFTSALNLGSESQFLPRFGTAVTRQTGSCPTA